MKSKSKIVCFSVSAVILAIVLALNIAIGIFSDVLDMWVVKYKTGESSAATRAAGAELVEEIQEEGTVLVRNENATLPLDRNTVKKVNVFGWASVDWLYAGSGSGKIVGQTSGKNKLFVDLYEALTNYGIEYNQDLRSMYQRFNSRRYKADDLSAGNNNSTGALHSFSYEFCRLYEPNINDANYYTEALKDGAKDFSNTALVVLGRTAGESDDCPKVQYKQTSSSSSSVTVDETRTYLEISTEEEALLTYVGQNFENVIVLINSTNVMELGFLEKIAGLDACLITATTGSAGANAIPSLLYGEKAVITRDDEGNEVSRNYQPIGPSGKTADTFAYDLTTSSTYANVGSGVKGTNGQGQDTTNFYTNGTGLYPMTEMHTNGSTNVSYSGVAYTDYIENIYLGYRWYETADKMGFWDSEKAKSTWGIENGYEDVVQYPFGYGLSYTTFEWTVVPEKNDGAALGKNDSIVFTVTVKNIGTHAGQDTVELYYEPVYHEGGIEKSALNLAAFAKTTQVLQPGDVQTIRLECKVSDMKSYDCYDKNDNGYRGYELESGNYILTLRTDAHTVAPDEMIAQGKATYTYHVDSDITYDEDEASGNPVENLFTGKNAVDGVAIDGNSDGTAEITYLTRDNFEGTFPYERAANREMAGAIRQLNLYKKEQADAWIDPNDQAPQQGVALSQKLYEGGSITALGMQVGNSANYENDEIWKPVLDALTESEMRQLVLHGYVHTEAVDSIGKPKTSDLDGPNQIGSFVDTYANQALTGFSSIVLAQSWNLELSYSMALTLGREAAANGINGWYGPGINVHRSPFGGRNYEYYSEDPVLSGLMSAYAVAAAKNAGVFSYLKHLCCYESESGRDGMYNWLTEQSLREIYLKPFELSVKELSVKDTSGKLVRTVGGCTGIMSSYGRIGAVWTGGSYALLTELVREEWGFKGAILTDYADHHNFMNGDQMLRAGGDLWMDGWNNNGAFAQETSSNSFKLALRDAAKHVIYMWANALATQADYNQRIENGELDGVSINTAPLELNFRWYIPVLVAIDVLAVGGCAVWIFFTLKKKPSAQTSDDAGDPPASAEE